ncbi:unnamed protein product [Adineta ricciae]|uniref:Uncharacterized protein n=1 Tax=Adineta ricciae TaxID=249248 RepID=A0A814N9U3_ADIRI|nr:unnamed protein product [Adineta ricciae]CAF1452168.1 unnamed protein product [Adineta ricciae]
MATASARSHNVKKNRTGLFAANDIYELQPTNAPYPIEPVPAIRLRNNSLASFFYSSLESKQQQTEQYNSMADSSHSLTLNNQRNAFPPSNVRHHKMAFTSSSPTQQRTHSRSHLGESKDTSTKASIMQSHASARLKSEVDYLRHKLKKHEEISRSVRLRDHRDLNSTSRDTLSYSTSYRFPSASTVLKADRIHKRFSSAATHHTTNTSVTMPTINDASTQTIPIHPNPIVRLVPPITEIDNNQQTIEYRPTHAYQVPQQSNIGNDSVFLPISSINQRSAKVDRQHKDFKSVSCPFYVLYLTNLTMQQNLVKDESAHNNESDMTLSKRRRVPVNSRTSTNTFQCQSTRRQINSRLSLNTPLTIDDNMCAADTKYLPTTTRHETSFKLHDLLRTSAWNHVQV